MMTNHMYGWTPGAQEGVKGVSQYGQPPQMNYAGGSSTFNESGRPPTGGVDPAWQPDPGYEAGAVVPQPAAAPAPQMNYAGGSGSFNEGAQTPSMGGVPGGAGWGRPPMGGGYNMRTFQRPQPMNRGPAPRMFMGGFGGEPGMGYGFPGMQDQSSRYGSAPQPFNPRGGQFPANSRGGSIYNEDTMRGNQDMWRGQFSGNGPVNSNGGSIYNADTMRANQDMWRSGSMSQSLGGAMRGMMQRPQPKGPAMGGQSMQSTGATMPGVFGGGGQGGTGSQFDQWKGMLDSDPTGQLAFEALNKNPNFWRQNSGAITQAVGGDIGAWRQARDSASSNRRQLTPEEMQRIAAFR